MKSHALRIDQCMAGFAIGDATSNAALLMRDALRALGFSSDIYCDPTGLMPDARDLCKSITDYQGRATDVIIHHFGIWSRSTDFFLAVPARKIICYHNITPGHFFRGYDDHIADRLDASRARLGELIQGCDACWAVSEYNALELRERGALPVHVLPLPFDPSATSSVSPSKALLARLRAPLTTILTVGRIAPNKRIEDLMRGFAHYQQHINPFSRLFIVGSDRSAPRYTTYLKWLSRELDAPNICFEGFVWPDALAAYYALADVYVSTSGHEGFCLPLLEAMAREIPVVAIRTGGVPEALDGAGMLLNASDPETVAHALRRFTSDPAKKSALLAGQAERLKRINARDIKQELLNLLNPLLDSGRSIE